MANIVEQAYEATRNEGDPHWGSVQLGYRDELQARADGVIRTGLTVNKFEEKVKELHEKELKDAPKTQLGTTNDLGEAPPATKAEATDKK
jgi:hypothetical protein